MYFEYLCILAAIIAKLPHEERKHLTKMSTSAVFSKLVKDAGMSAANLSSLVRPALLETMASLLGSLHCTKRRLGTIRSLSKASGRINLPFLIP